MKTKVICGGRPTNREKKTRTRIDPWQGNSGVVVGSARRRRSLILAALQLLARKIRAKAAGIETRIGNHTFRATGITAYLKNSGKLEVAQQIANHESPRTTKLYDRRQDEISLDEIERITI